MRLGFQSPLQLEYVDGRTWVLLFPLVYQRNASVAFTVPAGFVTDFASVPRFFWRVLPPTGQYGLAAVLHDYLYRFAVVPRDVADQVFKEAMLALAVPAWKAELMYRAVRTFGAMAYGREYFVP